MTIPQALVDAIQDYIDTRGLHAFVYETGLSDALWAVFWRDALARIAADQALEHEINNEEE